MKVKLPAPKHVIQEILQNENKYELTKKKVILYKFTLIFLLLAFYVILILDTKLESNMFIWIAIGDLALMSLVIWEYFKLDTIVVKEPYEVINLFASCIDDMHRSMLANHISRKFNMNILQQQKDLKRKLNFLLFKSLYAYLESLPDKSLITYDRLEDVVDQVYQKLSEDIYHAEKEVETIHRCCLKKALNETV